MKRTLLSTAAALAGLGMIAGAAGAGEINKDVFNPPKTFLTAYDLDDPANLTFVGTNQTHSNVLASGQMDELLADYGINDTALRVQVLVTDGDTTVDYWSAHGPTAESFGMALITAKMFGTPLFDEQVLDGLKGIGSIGTIKLPVFVDGKLADAKQGAEWNQIGYHKDGAKIGSETGKFDVSDLTVYPPLQQGAIDFEMTITPKDLDQHAGTFADTLIQDKASETDAAEAATAQSWGMPLTTDAASVATEAGQFDAIAKLGSEIFGPAKGGAVKFDGGAQMAALIETGRGGAGKVGGVLVKGGA